MDSTHKPTLGVGVYFAKGDYAGILRRLLALCVDLGVVLLMGVALGVAAKVVDADPSPELSRRLTWTWLGLEFLYLAVIKPSRIRSVGYRLTGTRIVTLRGERPSVLRMTFRLLLWLLGPFNLVYDLTALSEEATYITRPRS
jgi:uncharacterized RDD family membrane protein YckC